MNPPSSIVIVIVINIIVVFAVATKKCRHDHLYGIEYLHKQCN